MKEMMRRGMKQHSHKPILEKQIRNKCLMGDFFRTQFTAQF